MNIGALKELIENLPADTKLVVGTGDHSYRIGHASVIDMVDEGHGHYGEPSYDGTEVTIKALTIE